MGDFELLDIVDEDDRPSGKCTKVDKYANGFITRNVAVFIIDHEGKIIVTKRAENKRMFPGRYDVSACGNVVSRETYEGAAIREAKEELGIEGMELDFLGKIFNEFSAGHLKLRYFTGIFIGHYSGEIKLNNEISELKKLSVAEIEDQIKKEPEQFTPGFVNDFSNVKADLK